MVLWGGGIYNWFDPVTLIRGVEIAARRLPGLRLVFMSTGHPNPEIQTMWTQVEARRVAGELGLLGTHVFFNDSWVAYEDRADWLLDADIGVSTHFDHVETRFSFRTRILDYFWSGLPVICTAGDTLADDIERLGIGVTVALRRPRAPSRDALLELAEDAARRQECGRHGRWPTRRRSPGRQRPRPCADFAPIPDLQLTATPDWPGSRSPSPAPPTMRGPPEGGRRRGRGRASSTGCSARPTERSRHRSPARAGWPGSGYRSCVSSPGCAPAAGRSHRLLAGPARRLRHHFTVTFTAHGGKGGMGSESAVPGRAVRMACASAGQLSLGNAG